jgi:hypothetical protein
MSSASQRRRLDRLEGTNGDGPTFSQLYVQAVTEACEARERGIAAAKSLVAFARELVGPIEQLPEPPPRDPADEFPELRPPVIPPAQARDAFYDPREGGRILTRFGGLGNSADAIHAMPPPEPEVERFTPPVPAWSAWRMVVPSYASDGAKDAARAWDGPPPQDAKPASANPNADPWRIIVPSYATDAEKEAAQRFVALRPGHTKDEEQMKE